MMRFQNIIEVQDKEEPITSLGGGGFEVNIKNKIIIESTRSMNIRALNISCPYNRNEQVSVKIEGKNGDKVADFVLSYEEVDSWIRALDTARNA